MDLSFAPVSTGLGAPRPGALDGSLSPLATSCIPFRLRLENHSVLFTPVTTPPFRTPRGVFFFPPPLAPFFGL